MPTFAQSSVLQNAGQVSPNEAATANQAGPSPVRADDRITFTQRPALVGETAEQQFAVRLQMETQIVQSGQVAYQGATELGREQRRRVEVLEVSDGKLRRARVTFLSSRNQTAENEDPERLSPQSIHGKQYLVELGESGMMLTDAEGAIPPLDEYRLALDSVSNLGKPHPLAEILVNREVRVGERLPLPREVARELLGLDDQVGSIQQFELQLVRVERPVDAPAGGHAVFAATIETAPDDSSPLGMSIRGEVIIEPTTCRTVAADFQGPLRMSTIERTNEGILQYSAGGQVEVAIRATYRSPQQVASPNVLRRLF